MVKNKIAIGQIVSFIASIALAMSGCVEATKKEGEQISNKIDHQDTILVKQKNTLDKSYQLGFYSKSYSYYWLVGKDTLDFRLDIHEYEKDSTFSLKANHKGPILFTNVLRKIAECLPVIKEDFNTENLAFLHFRAPIYYLDLAKKLSSEYEQQFERKQISYEKFNTFLLQSGLNTCLDTFLNPLNKKVKRYGFEKFFLIDKKHYEWYLPNVDFSEYPDFTFNAHVGMVANLEKK